MQTSPTISLSISGMSCSHCVDAVSRALRTIPNLDVNRVVVGAADISVRGTARVDDAIVAAVAAIRRAGYDATRNSA
jgi:copper chaperone